MEEVYHIHQDCLTELSYLIIYDEHVLFQLSCVSKFATSLFLFRHSLKPKTNYTLKNFNKFKHLKYLDLSYSSKYTNLTNIKHLERLTLGRYINELNLNNYSKLTYLDCMFRKYPMDILSCINLVELNAIYSDGIENLIHLQNLLCVFNEEVHKIVYFTSLLQLTKLYLGYSRRSYVSYQSVIFSENCQLIDLKAEYIDFSSKIVNTKQMKKLVLIGCLNILYLNLPIIQTMTLDNVVNFNILDEDNSYKYLTHLIFGLNDRTLKFENMISLRFIELRKSNDNMMNSLATLSFLYDIQYAHSKRHTVNISNLNNVTHLKFINSDEVDEWYIPRNLKSLEIANADGRKNWSSNILNQINAMTNLTSLNIRKITFVDNQRILYLKNTTLQHLCLIFSHSDSFDELISLTSLKLNSVDIHSVIFYPLTNLKILTLTDCSSRRKILKCTLSTFINLEVLELNHVRGMINILYFANITRLTVNTRDKNIRISNANKLKYLQIVELNSVDTFLGFCKKGFSESVRDIYISYHDKINNILNITMKNVNIHFVRE